MTDTVNVPREALELFDRALRDADVSFYHAARQTLHQLLAAAPKAECELETQEREEKALRDKMFARVDRLFDIAQPEAPKVEREPFAWGYERKGFMPSCSMRKPDDKYDDMLWVDPLYRHPAPASDELLEALEQLVSDYESEGVTGPLMNCLRDLITKHKGPQS